MRILHIADLHLGLSLSQFKVEGLRKIRDEIELALGELERDLKAGCYDGLIVVGDVFEDRQVNRYYMMTMVRLFEAQLSSGGFVCFSNGNHDYWLKEMDFASLRKYEKFFLFLKPELQSFQFLHKGDTVLVHGLGYDKNHPSKDVTDLFPSRSGSSNDIVIGLVHGEVAGPGQKSEYYSVDPLRLSNKNYNYFALGHKHKATIYNAVISYPGTPFPQGYDETGRSSVNEVLIDSLHTRIETKPLVHYRIYNIKREITAQSRDEVILEAQKIWAELIEDSDDTKLIKMELIIKGPRSLELELDSSLAEDIFGPSSRYIPTLNTYFIEREEGGGAEPSSLHGEILSALDEALLRFKEGRARTEIENKLTQSLGPRLILEESGIRAGIIADMEARK